MATNTIDVTITATKRPDLLLTTLTSFKENLFKDHPLRGIINVDDVGNPAVDPFDIVTLCEPFFDKVVSRVSATPHFGQAFKWCWSQVESDLVFNLEEDWELLRPLDLSDLLNVFNQNPQIGVARLSAFPVGETVTKNWNVFIPRVGDFFEVPEELRIAIGFCGHPSLIRGEFVKKTVPYLDATRNPEKQFHRGGSSFIKDEILKWRYIVYSQPQQPPAIRDIGRRWMINNGWAKKGSKAFFTEWTKCQE